MPMVHIIPYLPSLPSSI